MRMVEMNSLTLLKHEHFGIIGFGKILLKIMDTYVFQLQGRKQTRWYLTYTAQDWMNPGPAVGTCTVQILETQGQTALKISEKPKCTYQPGYHKKEFKY